jgi:hypothetical protein
MAFRFILLTSNIVHAFTKCIACIREWLSHPRVGFRETVSFREPSSIHYIDRRDLTRHRAHICMLKMLVPHSLRC